MLKEMSDLLPAVIFVCCKHYDTHPRFPETAYHRRQRQYRQQEDDATRKFGVAEVLVVVAPRGPLQPARFLGKYRYCD